MRRHQDSESTDLSDRVLKKMQSKPMSETSSLFKSSYVPADAEPKQEDDYLVVLGESMLLDSLSKVLDSKLKPLSMKLGSLEAKVETLGQSQANVVRETMPKNEDLMKSIELRFSRFFSQTMSQTHKAISQGINFYNSNLADREDKYRQQHEASTRSYMQISRSMAQGRLKTSSDNYDKINKELTKLGQNMTQNNETILNVNKKLGDISFKMDEYIRERRRELNPHMTEQIDPEDIIDLDEQDIYEILIDCLNKQTSLIAMSNKAGFGQYKPKTEKARKEEKKEPVKKPDATK